VRHAKRGRVFPPTYGRKHPALSSPQRSGRPSHRPEPALATAVIHTRLILPERFARFLPRFGCRLTTISGRSASTSSTWALPRNRPLQMPRIQASSTMN